ncbi:dihydroxyacetone kinase subunit DhaL [Peribacillus sp. SCS-155]|uniref:dihydroxyacetone kinase subunit DhaL n=1 Tax=Peribacillus sedimenti TaxID=3115297 RepID=UPI003906BB08
MAGLILDRSFFLKAMEDMKNLAEEQRNHFSKLDSAIGDGDHGANLTIGFREVVAKLEGIDSESPDISTLLKKIGMILLGKVGGSSGPLYGSFFIKAGDNVKGKSEVSFAEFCDMIITGVKAIETRGKASIGDKTMLDAFLPGIRVLSEVEQSDDEIELFEKFVDEMKAGAESTIPLVAKKGRAMRLGERAVGHKDPGAESAWMLMDIFLKRLKEVSN